MIFQYNKNSKIFVLLKINKIVNSKILDLVFVKMKTDCKD